MRALALLLALMMPAAAAAQAPPKNPLWHEEKIKNYLPHMTWPEVQDLLTRTDIVIIPIASIEQHALHLPIGTDFLNGVERAKLVAQRTDALVAPILLPGNSPYHMEFPGTITLSSQTIQQVYFEAAQSLMKHGFRRFALLNSHGGNQIITRYIADRINQETEGIAVELGEAAAPFETRAAGFGRRVRHLRPARGCRRNLHVSLRVPEPRQSVRGANRHADYARASPEDAARGRGRRSDGHARLPGRGPQGEGHRQEDVHARDVRYRDVGTSEPQRSKRRSRRARDPGLR